MYRTYVRPGARLLQDPGNIPIYAFVAGQSIQNPFIGIDNGARRPSRISFSKTIKTLYGLILLS
jgi:hypothetical protein